MSRRVELLWFSDCPKHPVARRMLTDAIERLAPGTAIEEVDASDPVVATAHWYPNPPTIRVDGIDIEPGYEDPGDYTPCRCVSNQYGSPATRSRT